MVLSRWVIPLCSSTKQYSHTQFISQSVVHPGRCVGSLDVLATFRRPFATHNTDCRLSWANENGSNVGPSRNFMIDVAFRRPVNCTVVLYVCIPVYISLLPSILKFDGFCFTALLLWFYKYGKQHCISFHDGMKLFVPYHLL